MAYGVSVLFRKAKINKLMAKISPAYQCQWRGGLAAGSARRGEEGEMAAMAVFGANKLFWWLCPQ